MPFERRLSDGFVQALNNLYAQDSWWTRLANDQDVFIAIRDNAINVYSQGGSIGRITFDLDRVRLLTHIEYLSLPAAGDSYVDVTAGREAALTRPVVWNVDLYQRHLAQIKKRPLRFSGAERAGENSIACRNECVIDIEAAFSPDAVENPEVEGLQQQSSGRLDIVSLNRTTSTLVFTEVKLFVNSDIRSRRVPRVCDQLAEYRDFLQQQNDAIIQAYSNVLTRFGQLRGTSIIRGSEEPRTLQVDPVPRLLIIGFDDNQLVRINNEIKPNIVRHCQSFIPTFTENHVAPVGKPTSVTPAHLGV